MKKLLDRVALTGMLPAYLLYLLGAAVIGRQKAFAGWSELLSLLPGLTGSYLRRGFYRWALDGCGEGACISFGTVISHPAARIGRHVYVGPFCSLGSVTLEDDVLLGSHVSVMNGSQQHGIERLDIPIREQPGRWPRVTVGRDTWIGDRALIMADVGRHCVVGAGSVVSRPLPDFAIAVGVPAKVVEYRSETTGSGPDARGSRAAKAPSA